MEKAGISLIIIGLHIMFTIPLGILLLVCLLAAIIAYPIPALFVLGIGIKIYWLVVKRR